MNASRRITSEIFIACRSLQNLRRLEYAINKSSQHRMSNSSRKLRQTTLSFSSADQETKKRKMASNSVEVVEINDSPENDLAKDGDRSKYFPDKHNLSAGASRSASGCGEVKPRVTVSAMSKEAENADGKEGSSSDDDSAPQEFQFRSSSTAPSAALAPKAGTSVQDGSMEPGEVSPDLFSSQEGDKESQELNSDEWKKVQKDIPTTKPSQRQKDGNKWRGCPLSELRTSPDCQTLEELRPSENHSVMVRLPFVYNEDQLPHPHPTHYHDRWDNEHVRMPCSNKNEYPCKKDGKDSVMSRWQLIEEALTDIISGPYELEAAILKYNQRYEKKWSFDALHSYFTQFCNQAERDEFFNEILPKMVKLALQLPLLCTSPIPLLKARKKRSITMSQQQIACLLANAFFCTFPRRNARQPNSEYAKYPSINFNTLFSGESSSRKMEKLQCIVHYFRRVTKRMPRGLVTFTRLHFGDTPKWDGMATTLSKLHISSQGTIEDDGVGMLQVDFANKFIGGGALGNGLVQEEIRFMICPEMIVTRLFTEVLGKTESLLMIGCERFSNYDGYGNSFQWSGDYLDKTKRDSWGRLCCEVVAIDALIITDYSSQFNQFSVCRELNKAYAGFKPPNSFKTPAAVCTGNWGCGAFGGDKQLKALIQLLAAAAVGRDVCYFTFDDTRLVDDLFSIHEFLCEMKLAVGDIVKLIDQYHRRVASRCSSPKLTLYKHIIGHFEGLPVDVDTDNDYSNDSQEARCCMSAEERKASDAGKSDHNACDLSTQEMKDNTP